MKTPTVSAELPEALQLADTYASLHAKHELEHLYGTSTSYTQELFTKRVAARAALEKELRRLHAQVEELSAAQAGVPEGYVLVPVEALTRWRDAFAEELAAYDLDPPIHHIKESHDEIEAMLAAAPAITQETGNSVSAQGAAITAESAKPTPSPAPAQPVQEGERDYPPLPPCRYTVLGDIKSFGTFTGDQMRAYVDADRAARAAPQPAPAATADARTPEILTYKNQPGNVGAWRLGEACRAAKPGGDPIDHGLSLLQQLQERGYGVVAIAAQQGGAA